MGVLPKLHPDDRRLRRALYPQDHAARGAAGHTRGRVRHLHRDASGARNVHDADHRAHLLRDHHGELVRWLQISQRHSGRARCHRRRHDHRLGVQPVRPRLRRTKPGRPAGRVHQFRLLGADPRHRPRVLGLRVPRVILVTAIPFGIYDLVEAMDNVESAEAAGDDYPTTRVLTADGVVSLIGCLMGNPFINAVYIGHPGWKAMGGRIGYSAATGIMVIVLSWFGIISVLLALVPVVAISPILLYIGMLIGAQAFQTTPVRHAPAIVLAFTPHLAAWAKLQIDTMLGSTIAAAQAVGGMAADKVGAVKTAAVAALPQHGVLYHGLDIMGGGSILAGLVLGAIGVFVIERDFMKASAFALISAILTYFGFMHGEAVGIGSGFGVTPSVVLAYLVMAGGLYALTKTGESVSYSAHEDMHAAPAE